jgi:hypothetical protein
MCCLTSLEKNYFFFFAAFFFAGFFAAFFAFFLAAISILPLLDYQLAATQSIAAKPMYRIPRN